MILHDDIIQHGEEQVCGKFGNGWQVLYTMTPHYSGCQHLSALSLTFQNNRWFYYVSLHAFYVK